MNVIMFQNIIDTTSTKALNIIINWVNGQKVG